MTKFIEKFKAVFPSILSLLVLVLAIIVVTHQRSIIKEEQTRFKVLRTQLLKKDSLSIIMMNTVTNNIMNKLDSILAEENRFHLNNNKK